VLIVLAWRQRDRPAATSAPKRVVTALRRPCSQRARASPWLIVRDGRREVTPLLCALFGDRVRPTSHRRRLDPGGGLQSQTSHAAADRQSAPLCSACAPCSDLSRSLASDWRYMDQTIAVLLALVGVKLLVGGVVHVGPLESLAGVVLVPRPAPPCPLRASGASRIRAHGRPLAQGAS